MSNAHRIDNAEQLRQLIGEPTQAVKNKLATKLNGLTRKFIEQSPFVCLATCNQQGQCDVSPRGDPRGFVQILDDQTLLIPERPGNRLADSLLNILETSQIGLLFLIPGVGDTFRVNGRAHLTTDPQLLAPCTVEGKQPKLGIYVEIEEAYTQCSKAFLRSHLWDPSGFSSREQLPSFGEICRELVGGDFDASKYDQDRAERYQQREGFY